MFQLQKQKVLAIASLAMESLSLRVNTHCEGGRGERKKEGEERGRGRKEKRERGEGERKGRREWRGRGKKRRKGEREKGERGKERKGEGEGGKSKLHHTHS